MSSTVKREATSVVADLGINSIIACFSLFRFLISKGIITDTPPI